MVWKQITKFYVNMKVCHLFPLTERLCCVHDMKDFFSNCLWRFQMRKQPAVGNISGVDIRVMLFIFLNGRFIAAAPDKINVVLDFWQRMDNVNIGVSAQNASKQVFTGRAPAMRIVISDI